MILRLFEPAPGTGQVALSGLVEDVRTGEVWPFQGDAELLRVLARAAAVDDHRPAEAADPGESLAG